MQADIFFEIKLEPCLKNLLWIFVLAMLCFHHLDNFESFLQGFSQAYSRVKENMLSRIFSWHAEEFSQLILADFGTLPKKGCPPLG